MKNKFIILWLLGVLSTVAALPYIFTLQHDILAKAPVPLPLIGLLMVMQTAVLLAIAVFLGLKLSQQLNLPTLVFFEPNVNAKEKLKSIVKLAVPAGSAAAILIKLADSLFAKYTPQLSIMTIPVPAWKVLLAALYGGVVEELLMRLFFISLFAWIITKITKSLEPAKNNLVMWTAITAAAILFGLGHLPVTATLTAITPVVVLRAILLNGIAGVVFGWLFWKKGLESAIVAHFTADIVLLVILPWLMK